MGPLETIQAGFNNWLHEAQVHLTGKGITSGAALVAGVIAGTTTLWLVPLVIAIGGVGANMFFRLRDQWKYQDEMADKYRGEVADRLGIAPEAVTREHVKLAAYGNEEQGIDGNPILAQALERQRQKSWLVLGTALLAAVVTFTLLTWSGGGIAAAIGSGMVDLLGLSALPPALGFVAGIVGMMGGAVIAGLSSIFIQDGLEFGIGHFKGINAPSAHDRILALEARQDRGKSVTPEQIFQIKIATSPQLDERVMAMTGGKHFHALKADMQERVLARIDAKGEMLMLAEEINKKAIDAKELAFILTGQQTVQPTPDREAPCEDKAPARSQSFMDKLGLTDKGNTKSHVERINESNVVPIEQGRA
jgi:hypothetical protein